jgi:hypothetical protein
MKNLKLLIIFSLFLVSCTPTEFKVENQEKASTIEILNLAQQDTVLYKVVHLNNNLYTINTNTNLVEYMIYNDQVIQNLLLTVSFIMVILLVGHVLRD